MRMPFAIVLLSLPSSARKRGHCKIVDHPYLPGLVPAAFHSAYFLDNSYLVYLALVFRRPKQAPTSVDLYLGSPSKLLSGW